MKNLSLFIKHAVIFLNFCISSPHNRILVFKKNRKTPYMNHNESLFHDEPAFHVMMCIFIECDVDLNNLFQCAGNIRTSKRGKRTKKLKDTLKNSPFHSELQFIEALLEPAADLADVLLLEEERVDYISTWNWLEDYFSNIIHLCQEELYPATRPLHYYHYYNETLPSHMSRNRTWVIYILLKEFADKPILCDHEGHRDTGLLMHQQNWVHIIINACIYLFVC